MKSFHPLFLAVTFGTASVATTSAAIVVVDDFADGSLSEYTQTRVLEGSVASLATTNVSFSSSTGVLTASYSGTPNAAEQVVLLRDDFSLAVGETLTVDVSQAVTPSEMDFGIAVGSTKTPTLVTSGDLDTRNTMDWAAVYVRPSQNTVRSLVQPNGGTLISATGILATDETLVAKLWIRRNTATSFSLGYINTSAVEFTSQTFTIASGVGNAIGFYADLRAAGGALGGLDNLTIVPEPTTAALAGLAAFGLAFRRRR